MLAKPRLTRTPEYVRQARYSLTNSYLTGQSTEICGRASKCADKRPFHRWQEATKQITVNPKTPDSGQYRLLLCSHTHTNFACSETSRSIDDSQTAEIY